MDALRFFLPRLLLFSHDLAVLLAISLLIGNSFIILDVLLMRIFFISLLLLFIFPIFIFLNQLLLSVSLLSHLFILIV